MQILVRPPSLEFLETDIAVTFGVGGFEDEQTLGTRDVSIEFSQQRMEFLRIQEAIAVAIPRFERAPWLSYVGLHQCGHDCSCYLSCELQRSELHGVTVPAVTLKGSEPARRDPHTGSAASHDRWTRLTDCVAERSACSPQELKNVGSWHRATESQYGVPAARFACVGHRQLQNLGADVQVCDQRAK